MKLHYTSHAITNTRFRKIKCVIQALKLQVEEVVHENKADVSQLSPFNLTPLLQTPQGNFFSSNTIIRYLAAKSNYQLYGGDNLYQRASVDQWLDVTTCDFQATAAALVVVKEGKDVVDIPKTIEDINKFLAVIEKSLSNKKYLVGDSFTLADFSLAAGLSNVFTIMLGQQERKNYPNITTWYLALVTAHPILGTADLPKESHKVFKPKQPKKQKEEKGEKKENKEQKQAAKTVQKPKEEGDDLFDETEPAAPKIVAPKPPQKEKKKVIAKSIVVFDVKVYEQETDLLVLFNKIKTQISVEGLVWNNQPKVLPVAYGMNKLQIGCVIEDQKVSVQDFYEKIEEWEEVQSIDTVSFNKL